MIKVNAKYKLQVDATIDTVHYLKIGEVVKTLNASPTHIWEGTIEKGNANNKINVELELAGLDDSEWTLEVSVAKLKLVGNDKDGKPVYIEDGDYVKINPFPIKEKMEGSVLFYDEYHKIEW